LDQVDEAVVILGRHREKIAPAWEPIAIFDRCLDLSPASLADARSRINPRATLAPLKHAVERRADISSDGRFPKFARCF
jgi:hypothetical protein